MEMQPATSISGRIRREPDLEGVTKGSLFIAPLGTAHPGEVVPVVDEKSLWEKYMPVLRVAGIDVKLGPDSPPLPKVLADALLEADEEYLAMKKFLTWLEMAATPEDILALAGEVTVKK